MACHCWNELRSSNPICPYRNTSESRKLFTSNDGINPLYAKQSLNTPLTRGLRPVISQAEHPGEIDFEPNKSSPPWTVTCWSSESAAPRSTKVPNCLLLAMYRCAARADGLEEKEPMQRCNQSNSICHRLESWDSPKLGTGARRL